MKPFPAILICWVFGHTGTNFIRMGCERCQRKAKSFSQAQCWREPSPYENLLEWFSKNTRRVVCRVCGHLEYSNPYPLPAGYSIKVGCCERCLAIKTKTGTWDK